MTELLQSTAQTVLGRGYLTADHISPATGLDPAFTISKNGGNFANPSAGASVMTEIETTGWYKFALSTTDTNTLGPLLIRGTHATMDNIEAQFQVVAVITDKIDAIKAKTDLLDVSDITVITGLDGADMVITIGATYDETITGLTISADWEAIYFTLKDDTALIDGAALLQARESNPGVGTDGLLYLNGAATTAGYGSLTVSQAAGTVQIVLSSAATAQLRKSKTNALSYDLKELTTASGDNVITSGTATVQLTPTKTV